MGFLEDRGLAVGYGIDWTRLKHPFNFCKYFENIKLGKILALILASILFTAAHVYWSPNLQILIFDFLLKRYGSSSSIVESS